MDFPTAVNVLFPDSPVVRDPQAVSTVTDVLFIIPAQLPSSRIIRLSGGMTQRRMPKVYNDPVSQTSPFVSQQWGKVHDPFPFAPEVRDVRMT